MIWVILGGQVLGGQVLGDQVLGGQVLQQKNEILVCKFCENLMRFQNLSKFLMSF